MTTDTTAWEIAIDRDDIRDARCAPLPGAALQAGEVRVSIDLVALTANNITYAVFGKPSGLFGNDQGYWDFFSPPGTPGRLPVWGFATVIDSACDGVTVGESFYGYYPLASHAVLTPGRVGPHGFTDVTPRRTSLPAIYNSYSRIAALADYRAHDHDYWPVFRPLFLTGWLIADQFADEDGYGAAQIIIASASSKTAIGLGHSLKSLAPGMRSIGLTSASNVAALTALHIYDVVLGYDDVASLDPATPSAFVDMAGNEAVTRSVHGHFGNALTHSMVVGKSHWDAAAADSAALPGPQRLGFFAPARSEKRSADWGREEFGRRIGSAWLAFMQRAPTLTTLERIQGSDAALAAYHALLDGRAPASRSLLLTP